MSEAQIGRAFASILRGLRHGAVGGRVQARVDHETLLGATGIMTSENFVRKVAPLASTITHDGKLIVGETATRIRAAEVRGKVGK